MRLFIALKPDAPFLTALNKTQERLRAAGAKGTYLTPDDLHLTLAFIGQWEEDITSLLPPVGRPFTLTMDRPGVFPEAKVLWAGLKPSPELNDLADRTRQALTGNGIPFDPRPFYPHITLIRKPLLPERLDLSTFQVPRAVWTVEEICLYKSERDVSGMRYTVIGTGPRGSTPLSPDRPAGAPRKNMLY